MCSCSPNTVMSGSCCHRAGDFLRHSLTWVREQQTIGWDGSTLSQTVLHNVTWSIWKTKEVKVLISGLFP